MSKNQDEANRIVRELKTNGIAVGADNSSIRSLVWKEFGTTRCVSFYDLGAGGLVYVSKSWLFGHLKDLRAKPQRDREETTDW